MELSKLERRILREWWDDGLIDLFAGLGVLLIGIGWQFDLVMMGLIVPPLLVPLWGPTRERIVVPRAGFVVLGEPTRGVLTRGNWILVAAGVVTLLLGVAGYFVVRGGSLGGGRTLIAGLPAFLLGLGGLASWAVFRIPRLPAYAAVLCAAGVGTAWLGLGPAPAMLLGGGVMTLAGGALLATFLKEHPLPPEAE
jgi:hypothetical protein